mgnify:CR=1 FL=1
MTNFHLCISNGYRENTSFFFTSEIGIPTCSWCHTSQIRGGCNSNSYERVSGGKLLLVSEMWFLPIVCSSCVKLTNSISVFNEFPQNSLITTSTHSYKLSLGSVWNLTCDITHLVGIPWIWKWSGSERDFTKGYYSSRGCPRELKIGLHM